MQKYIVTTVGLVIVTGIYLVIRSQFTEAGITDDSPEILNNPFVGASFTDQLGTVFVTFLMYIKLLIFPHPLSHDYYFNQIPVVGFANPLAIVSLILHVALLLFCIRKLLQGDRSLWLYGVMFYYITFSIVSNLFFTVGVTMSERFIYVSSFGFALVVAYFLNMLLKSGKRNVVYGLLILIVGLYSVKTFTRNPQWKNNFTLFTHDVFISENSAKLQTAAGGELIAESDKVQDQVLKDEYLDRAVGHLNKALEIYPQHSNAWLLLGNATFKMSSKSFGSRKDI